VIERERERESEREREKMEAKPSPCLRDLCSLSTYFSAIFC
jgi:hypothetical protein